ncbi:MAG: cell division protein ZapE [Rhizobiaceae bacterium]
MHIRDGLQPRATIAQRYQHLVEQGAIKRDPVQLRIVSALDRLSDEIASKRLAKKSSSLGWLFGKRREHKEPVKGLYIHGGVGRGKTMLMDLFFEMLPVKRKRRAHFNDFMADVHDRIQRHRQARKEGKVSEDDPIPPIARDIAEEAWVICFDEFTVTDIADAMILSRLFSALFNEGVVLVATSNVAPQDLYRDGLNRQLFLPFVATLERHTHVLPVLSDTDYRLEKLDQLQVYMTPLGAETDRRMDEAWRVVCDGATPVPQEILVKGRHIAVPTATSVAARFEFADLCSRPLGARDYIAIATRYPTLVVDNVPQLADGQRNEAKRFILLIDTLYDHHTRLIISAATSPDQLYGGKNGTEAFEFERTSSRLIEMQSRDWLKQWDDAQAQHAGR